MTRVLIVDGDPLVCSAIEIYLDRHGFELTLADGGEAGLRALEESCFDLMLVDIFMPHMRGFESIRFFHERVRAGKSLFTINWNRGDFRRVSYFYGSPC